MIIDNESMLNTLPESIIDNLEIIDHVEFLDKKTIELLQNRIKDMKPLDSDLAKILSDNFLDLL